MENIKLVSGANLKAETESLRQSHFPKHTLALNLNYKGVCIKQLQY